MVSVHDVVSIGSNFSQPRFSKKISRHRFTRAALAAQRPKHSVQKRPHEKKWTIKRGALHALLPRVAQTARESTKAVVRTEIRRRQNGLFREPRVSSPFVFVACLFDLFCKQHFVSERRHGHFVSLRNNEWSYYLLSDTTPFAFVVCFTNTHMIF